MRAFSCVILQVQIGRLFPAAGAHAAAAAATTTTSSSDPLVPGHFILHVPRYYPHEPPLVHASAPWCVFHCLKALLCS
jgi:hypothetical protein